MPGDVNAASPRRREFTLHGGGGAGEFPTLMGFLVTIALLWFLLPRLWRYFAAWKAQSAAERSFAIRFTIFSWVLAFIFIAALLFLPNKGRLLLLVPVFLTGATLAKWWQTSRERLRRDAEVDQNFARARRLN